MNDLEFVYKSEGDYRLTPHLLREPKPRNRTEIPVSISGPRIWRVPLSELIPVETLRAVHSLVMEHAH